MKRRFVYARTLDDLREKEKRIQKDKCDGIKTEARYTTIDELFDLWANMKRYLIASSDNSGAPPYLVLLHNYNT